MKLIKFSNFFFVKTTFLFYSSFLLFLWTHFKSASRNRWSLVTCPCATGSVVRSSLLLCSLNKPGLRPPPGPELDHLCHGTRLPRLPAGRKQHVAHRQLLLLIACICRIFRPYLTQCMQHRIYVQHLCHCTAKAKLIRRPGSSIKTSFFLALELREANVCRFKTYKCCQNMLCQCKLHLFFRRMKEEKTNFFKPKKEKHKKTTTTFVKKIGTFSHFLELYI